ADARVLVQAGDEILFGQPDLLNRVPTLEIQNLVKARHDVASLDSGDDVRTEIDTAYHNVARLLARVLEDLRQDGGDLTMLRSDGLEIRMGRQIGRHYRDALGRISVDVLGYIELFDIAL